MHRTWKYNEVSARYTALPNEFYYPAPETIGVQAKSNKQMRDETADNPQAAWAHGAIKAHSEMSYTLYESLLKADVPRELARTVLPLNIYTHFFASVDLHNLFHFLKLRLHEHAQMEIRVYAEAMLKLIEPIVPIAVDAFRKLKLDAND